MRFCAECDCVALKGESGYENATCPKCGSTSWKGNEHEVLKFTNARSIMWSNDAALDDSKDDRDAEKYVVKRHFMFHHNGATSSYVMRKAGFGIEF